MIKDDRRRLWCWGLGCGAALEKVAPKTAAMGKALLGNPGAFNIASDPSASAVVPGAPAKRPPTPFRLPEAQAPEKAPTVDRSDDDDEAVSGGKAARVKANRFRSGGAAPQRGAWGSNSGATNRMASNPNNNNNNNNNNGGGPKCPSPLDASSRAARRFFLGVGLVVRGEAPFIEEWARHYLAEGAERL